MLRRSISACALLVICSGMVTAQDKEFSRTVALDPGGSLRVEGSKGSMRITGWDRSEVEIRARIEVPRREDADYARRVVEATRIDVAGQGGSVTVATNYDDVPERDGVMGWALGRGDRTVPAVHYEIHAPRRIALAIDSDRGPAAISGFEGRFDFVVDRGELHLSEASGELRLEIDRGDRSRIDGFRGSLTIEADRTDLDIDAQALDRDSRIEIDRGDVEVRLPEGQGLTVHTDISRRGDFRTDFPIEWSTSDPRHSQGRINGGGTALTVESDRATIELRRR
jgi:hypothetical protein